MSVPTANQTPIGNTGSPHQQLECVYQLTAHLDWISVTGLVEDFDAIPDLMNEYFGTKYVFEDARPRHNGRFYEGSVRCPLGTTFEWVSTEKMDEWVIRLDIPGKPLNHIRKERLHEFCRSLFALGLTATRFDWSIDDHSKNLKLEDIENAGFTNNFVGFKTFTSIKTVCKENDEIGWTCYVGSRQSDKFIRFYDKEVESLGAIKSIRMETQVRSDIAAKYWEIYCSYSDVNLAAVEMSKIMLGNVRFIERTDGHTDRAKLLDWWQSFVDAVGGFVKVSVPRVQPMISQKIAWIEKQVVATLAVIFSCKGFDNGAHWLEAIIQKAIKRLKPRHRKWIEVWRERRSARVEYGVG